MDRLAALKRAIRPFIPDPLMARLRLHGQSRGARTNVDVAVAGRAARRRWLRTTPDTYRVRRRPPPEHPTPFAVVDDPSRLAAIDEDVVVVTAAGAEAHAGRVARVLAGGPHPAVVLGEVAAPRLLDGRRGEPEVAPLAVAARAAVLAETGPLPPAPDLVPALLERIRAAGHAYTLLPAPPDDAPARRADALDGPIAVVLSLVPIHDVGGGSRPAQLARALLRRGFQVTFVHAYPSYETTDTGLRYLHPGLEQHAGSRFDPARLVARSRAAATRLAVVAAPHAELARAAAELGATGFTVVYDVIDDWAAGSLGGDWYRPEVEQRIAAAAAATTAGTSDLVGRMGGLGVEATLLPNGVDVDVFGQEPGPVPADFPEGAGPVVGYHGSLWADWIDWDGIAAVADADPGRRVVLIGDHRGRRPVQRPNLHYLGLKPQLALAPYVARFAVGLLPRVVDATTHAMSPLKVYEYLAAGVPVAAPPLRSLTGIAGVHTAPGLAAAVDAALAAPPPDPGPTRAAHSWESRAAGLLAAAGIDPPPATGTPATAVLRPPIHYPRQARRL